MPAIRHTTDQVLDAVKECVLAVGVRRTTLTDVAKRAGTSRMTLYRRYPDLRALVAELMTREFGQVLAQVDLEGGPEGRGAEVAPVGEQLPTARDRVVAHTVAAVRALHGNPLLTKVIDVDPELLLPYVLSRVGATQHLAVGQFLRWLDEGFADGSIRQGDREAMAYGLLLTVQSYVFSMRAVESDGVGDERLYGELRQVLDRSLAP